MRLLKEWLLATGTVVEFMLDGHTFQVSGRKGMVGAFERFFHPDSHPTRSQVGDAELLGLLAQAQEFLLADPVKPRDQWRKISRSELEREIGNLFPTK